MHPCSVYVLLLRTWFFAILACELILVWSCCAESWSSHLRRRYRNKAEVAPVILCVVDENSASTVLPVLVASVLALPGRLERRLTVVATTPYALAACARVHSDCHLDAETFSPENFNLTSIGHFNSSSFPTKPKVKRSLDFLQVTWGKVCKIHILSSLVC